MSLAMVTYADLGKLENNKTPGAKTILRKFDSKKELTQVICRLESGSPFTNTYQALPWWKHISLGALSKLINVNKRDVEEQIFDKNASKRLEKAEVTLIHPARFQNTINKCKEYDSILMGIATVGHQTYAHELEREEYSRFEIDVEPKKLERYGDRDWKEFYKQFDHIIALSNFVKRSFIEKDYPENQISIAPTDIDTEKFSPRSKPKEGITDGFDVIFVASGIWPLKGLIYLLKAWKKMNLNPATLHIFGRFTRTPEKLQDMMEQMIEKDSSIVRHGIVNNPEYYMQRADVMVQPSLFEGLSKVLLESMACGLPTISTQHSKGIVEDGESGIVVPIRDPEAIAENIQMLYEDKELREELGKNARQAVLNKPSYAESIWKAYQEIIEREGLG
jgi:glycosyltransferase involved in cell wall biosynthesis